MKTYQLNLNPSTTIHYLKMALEDVLKMCEKWRPWYLGLNVLRYKMLSNIKED